MLRAHFLVALAFGRDHYIKMGWDLQNLRAEMLAGPRRHLLASAWLTLIFGILFYKIGSTVYAVLYAAALMYALRCARQIARDQFFIFVGAMSAMKTKANNAISFYYLGPKVWQLHNGAANLTAAAAICFLPGRFSAPDATLAQLAFSEFGASTVLLLAMAGVLEAYSFLTRMRVERGWFGDNAGEALELIAFLDSQNGTWPPGMRATPPPQASAVVWDDPGNELAKAR